MSNVLTNRSPIHDWLQDHCAKLRHVRNSPFATRLQTEMQQRRAIQSLAVSDLTGPAKLGIKGKDAHGWLASQDVDVPSTVYESRRLADGGIIVRLAGDEFILESGMTNESVPTLAQRLETAEGRSVGVERQEATFVLVGSRAPELLAQTCGINFREAPVGRLVMTRVAGVNCAVLPELLDVRAAFRFWIDYTYAVYLWETLVEILEDLGGSIVGVECLFSDP